MFFSHAIALSSSYPNAIKLIIPENGLISLNIPLTFSRMGSSSTRTTHPHYIALLQKLLLEIGSNVTLSNPYQFKTKGEMFIECKEMKFLQENYNLTMSCSHPDIGRMNGENQPRHCGDCLPCIIRRAAIKKAGITDTSNYRSLTLQETLTTRMNLNSYMIAIKKFDERYSFLRVQNSGQLIDNIAQYAELYTRGMHEMQSFLEDI